MLVASSTSNFPTSQRYCYLVASSHRPLPRPTHSSLHLHRLSTPTAPHSSHPHLPSHPATMTSLVGKYAAKKLLGKQMDAYKHKRVAGADDPYFARVPGRNGKLKKVKKQIPDFIPEGDAHRLARAKSLAYRLDMSLFNFAGIRFGWSSVVGIIPAYVLPCFLA